MAILAVYKHHLLTKLLIIPTIMLTLYHIPLCNEYCTDLYSLQLKMLRPQNNTKSTSISTANLARNNQHKLSITQLPNSSTNNTSETAQCFFRASNIHIDEYIHFDNKCNNKYIHLISAFTIQCYENALFWLHRNLYLQLFLSTKIPKYIFILFNQFRGKHCINQQSIYYKFLYFIDRYFDQNVIINIYFQKNPMLPGESRNFLANEINQFLENPINSAIRNNILSQYHNEIVVTFFDSDDIVHPQKYEILDKLYSEQHINGSILHQLLFLDCKNTNAYFWWKKVAWKRLKNFMKIEQLELDQYLDLPNDYQILSEFHGKQIRRLSMMYKFHLIHDDNVKLIELSRDTLMNKYYHPRLTKNNHPPYRDHFAREQIDHGQMNDSLKEPKVCYGNGWVTTTLNRLLSHNGYDAHKSKGEDIKFNWDTIMYGFDYYLLPFKLGYYCKWEPFRLLRSDRELELQNIRDSVRLIDY